MGVVNDLKVLTGKKTFGENVEKPSSPPKKILVVEDETSLLNALESVLSSEGFKVTTAANGKEGLKAAIENSPDLILLDLLMPIMDGKTMLKKLRDLPEFKKLPVIILTNAGEVDNIRETQRYFDAIYFLIKSNVQMEDIVTKVKTLLGYTR